MMQGTNNYTIEIDIEGMIGEEEDSVKGSSPAYTVNSYRGIKEILAATAGVADREIVLNIRSIGGNVEEAILIHDALQGCGAAVTSRCYGYVASAATIIAQAAGKGRREISGNALYLIHESSCQADGNTEDFNRTLDLLHKTDERIAAIYAHASGKPVSSFLQLMACNDGEGRWLAAEEAIEAGLADRIIPATVISNKNRRRLRRAGLPALPKESQKQEKNMENLKKLWNSFIEQLRYDYKSSYDEEPEEAAQVPVSENHIRQIESLESRIRELEADNAKLSAKETRTLPKEDPSVNGYRTGGNLNSYENDIKNIINQ